MDSALSRMINISLEDRNGYRGVRSSGFSTYTCPNNYGEPAEEMSRQGRKLVTTDEPAVVTKLLFDAVIMEDSQDNGCFPNPTSTN